MKSVFTYSSRIEAPVEQVFAWHERPGAFERLTPPWESIKVLQRHGGIRDGANVVVEIKLGPIPTRWVIRHQDYEQNRQFRDVQLHGPFRSWEHTHRFEPEGDAACRVEDHIDYELGSFGSLGENYLRDRLQRMFKYRHHILARDLELHRHYGAIQPLRILVSGSTGLVGSALVPLLTTGGHHVTRLVRSRPEANEDAIEWHPDAGQIDAERLEGFDAVIHLAGESIAGRWTEEKKRRILESREKGTRLLSEALARLEPRPRVMLSTSAIGIYGNRGDEILTEKSPSGAGFLSEVCQAWEAAAEPAARAGIRVVHPRLGVVLSPRGGALGLMLKPFEFGVGGRLGGGEQFMSWIAIEEVIRIFYFLLVNDSLRGPLNAVAPDAVTNAEFTRILGKALGRPTLLPAPTWALQNMLGEMADEMLLTSVRAQPKKLLDAGYKFELPELEGALRFLLGKD